MLKANKQIAGINKRVESAKPIKASEAALMPHATDRGIRLSYLETSQPEMGKPTNELTGILNSRVPSCASLKSKKVLIVGILDAQVEKLKPDKKKKIFRKSLCLLNKVILGFVTLLDWSINLTRNIKRLQLLLEDIL